jgi:hypothetical protein
LKFDAFSINDMLGRRVIPSPYKGEGISVERAIRNLIDGYESQL